MSTTIETAAGPKTALTQDEIVDTLKSEIVRINSRLLQPGPCLPELYEKQLRDAEEELSLAIGIARIFNDENRRYGWFPPIHLLDRLADGIETEEDRARFYEPDWWDDLLPRLMWWNDVAVALLLSNGFDCSPDPSFAKQRGEILELFDACLCAYVPHMREQLPYDEREIPWNSGHPEVGMKQHYSGTLKLLKCYALYRRRICAFAQELFPAIDSKRKNNFIARLMNHI